MTALEQRLFYGFFTLQTVLRSLHVSVMFSNESEPETTCDSARVVSVKKHEEGDDKNNFPIKNDLKRPFAFDFAKCLCSVIVKRGGANKRALI